MVCRNAKRILFPTDFSAVARASLREAEVLAKAQSATLVILHVQKSSPGDIDASCIGPMPPSFEILKRMFEEAKPSDPSIDVKYRFAIGDPVTEILRAAEEENAEMIVMGTRGRKSLSRLWKEGIADSVIRRASCPVVTCRGSIPIVPRVRQSCEVTIGAQRPQRFDYAL
jgi:nucleotide-binding universal stress UspA family protein